MGILIQRSTLLKSGLAGGGGAAFSCPAGGGGGFEAASSTCMAACPVYAQHAKVKDSSGRSSRSCMLQHDSVKS
jgi:hypothetical protein